VTTSQLAWRLTGALPTRQHVLRAYEIANSWRSSTNAAAGDLLIQRWNLWTRDQWGFGSCVGQAFGGAIETQVGDEPRISGLGIWRESRRIQGMVESTGEGTRPEYAINAIQSRGWDVWEPGEDRSQTEAGSDAPKPGDDLVSELQAHDNRRRITQHIFVRPREIDDVLANGLGIVFVTGTKSPFSTLQPDELATERHLGGYEGFHAMLVVGKIGGRYLVANSWGTEWSGATVAGEMRPGKFWASEDVIRGAREHHALRIGGPR
jgi:hypothetical protein